MSNPEYVRLVWAAYCAKVGCERIMSSAEFALLTRWRDKERIPLRVVLQVLDQTPKVGETLAYYDRAVLEEETRRQRALSVGR